jgi:hypothetical protein
MSSYRHNAASEIKARMMDKVQNCDSYPYRLVIGGLYDCTWYLGTANLLSTYPQYKYNLQIMVMSQISGFCDFHMNLQTGMP